MKYLTYQNNRILVLLALYSFVLVLALLPLTAFGQAVSLDASESAGLTTQFLSWFGRLIGTIVLTIASMFTYVGGMLLDTAVLELVLGMGEKIRGASGNGGSIEQSINQAWTVVRDISNIVFIFGFVYLGIRTIFDYDSSFTKRMLGSLIIAALLINFSLFFTKVIIDASNILAVEIYETLVEPSFNLAAGQTGGIAATVAGQMGILSWFEVPDADTFANLTDGGNFAFYIAGAIFLIIAGFVFAAGGVLLIVRFVALILIMIFSPILFAALVFPQTVGYAKKLWGLLINYSFFAPIYLFLIYISLLMMAATQQVINPGNRAFSEAITVNAANNSIDAFGVILNFVIISIFMIAALMIARTLGVTGADQAIKIGGNIRKGAQGVVGRNTVGRASSLLRKGYDSADAKMTSTTGGRAARRLLNVGTLGLTSDRVVRGTLQKGEKEKFGSSQSLEDSQKIDTEIRSRRGNIQEQQKLEGVINDGTGAPAGAAGDGARIAMEKAVATASTKQLEELSQKRRESVAHLMTNGQIDNLAKSDKLSEADTAKIRTARATAIQAVYDRNKGDLSKASIDQLTSMGSNYLNKEENSVRLDSGQMDKLKDKLTPTEYANLSSEREKALEKLAKGGTIGALDKDYILGKKPTEISKMPSGALVELSSELPITALSKISQDGTLKKEDQKKIRSKIEAFVTPHVSYKIGKDGKPELDKNGDQIKVFSNDDAKEYDKWLENSPLGRQFGK